MKKILLIIATVVFVACSKDKEVDENSWIQIKINYDEATKGPEGTVYLFNLTDNKIEDYKLDHSSATGPFMKDVNNETVRAFETYKIKSSKGNDGRYINYSSAVVFYNEVFGYANSGKEYDIMVVLVLDYNPPYMIVNKRVKWNRKEPIQLTREFEFEKPNSDSKNYYEEW